MRTWSLGINALQRFRSGSITVEEMPWYVMLAEWLVDGGPLSCGHIPEIPFPNWFPKVRDTDYPEEVSTWKDYYGDLSQWYHCRVCNPIFEWSWHHPKRKAYYTDLGYDRLKEIFYTHNPEYFDEAEQRAKEDEEEDARDLGGEG